MRTRVFVWCPFLLSIVWTGLASDWPQFRGPEGQGHARAVELPTEWSETENVLWKTALPGRGWSSPVIEGDRIWVTTAIETPASPEQIEQRLKDHPQASSLALAASVSCRAVCLDRKTGAVLKEIELIRDEQPQPIHRMNSYASPSPVTVGGRLFCHFGAAGTACLDTDTGEILWTNHELRIQHENGAGATPVLWGGLLIVQCDGTDEQFIAAIDQQTGTIAWKTERSGTMRDNPQFRKSYGTPLIVPVGSEAQIISPASDWLYGYRPETGEELWKLSYGTLGFSTVPRPVSGHGLAFICTGFMRSELIAVRYDGADGNPEPHEVWRESRSVPKMSSPILVGDELYMVADSGGIVSCLDARTGSLHWRERLGGNHSASPLFADGKIFFFSREGETHLIAPGPEYRLLARNEIQGEIMASPAAVDRALYIRTDRALYRIEKSAATGSGN